jgi:MFS transporter, DHA1 family, tetracycline resistance protein
MLKATLWNFTKQQPNAGLRCILVALFLDGISIGMCQPVLPKLLHQLVGNFSTASYLFGFVSTLYALMLFLFSPVQGALSDRFGRKPLLLISLFGTGVSQLALAAAPNLFWIAVAQVVNGCTGASLAVVFASIADLAPPKDYAKSFGWVGVTLGFAWVVGPAIGGLLSIIGLRVPFFAAAIISGLNLLYGFRMVAESHPQEHRTDFLWRGTDPVTTLNRLRQNSIVFTLAGVIFCTDLALQCFVSTWILFTTYKFQWSVVEAGLSLTLLGLMTALVQGTVMRSLMSRFGNQRTLVLSLVLSLMGYLFYALASQSWMLYGAIALNSIDFLVKPTAQGWLSSHVSLHEQGAIQGALASQTALAAMIGPLVATGALSYFTSVQAPLHLPEIPFLLGAGLFALALWFTWVIPISSYNDL